MKRQLTATLPWVVAAAIVFLLPYVATTGPSRLLVITILLYAMLGVGWNMSLGFGGIFNFAHLGFFGLGGYTMAICTKVFGLDGWIGIPLAVLVGCIAGAVAYLPVIRMRGIYVGLITFVFVQLCYHVMLALPGISGGSAGMTGIPGLKLGEFSLGAHNGMGYMWLIGAALVCMLFFVSSTLRSPFGRSIIAIRDNEAFAASRGMLRIRQHLFTFIMSGALAAFTGALYVSFFRVTDSSLFGFSFVVLGLSLIFLGGTGHVWGPVLGAILVTVIDRQLASFDAWRLVVIAVVTILVLIFLPRGIAGLVDGLWRGLRDTSESIRIRVRGSSARPSETTS